MERTPVDYDLYIDFSKGGETDKLNGLFKETGVMGMLDAEDYDKIYMVSSFMGAIVNRLCGLDHTPITPSYVPNVEVNYAIHLYGRRPGRRREELEELCKMIKKSNEFVLPLFAQYQASELQNCKRNSLTDRVDNIEDVGSIEVLHSGKHESAHKHL